MPVKIFYLHACEKVLSPNHSTILKTTSEKIENIYIMRYSFIFSYVKMSKRQVINEDNKASTLGPRPKIHEPISRSSSLISSLMSRRMTMTSELLSVETANTETKNDPPKILLDKALIKDNLIATEFNYDSLRANDKDEYMFDLERFHNSLKDVIKAEFSDKKIFLDSDTHSIVRLVLKFVNKTNEQLLLYSDDNFFSTNVSYLTLNNPRGSNLSLRSNEEFRSGRAEYLVLIRAAIILSVRMSLFRIHDKFMKYGEKNECRDGFNKWFKTYAQNLTNAMDPINDQPVDIKSVRFTTYNSKKPRGQRIQVITRHLDMMYFQCCIDNARHTYDKLGMSFNSQFFAIDSITQLINQWVTHSDMEEFMKIYAHLFSILSALDRATTVCLSHGHGYVTNGIIIPY